MRRAYALLRQGVACVEVSWSGPGARCVGCASRPSAACSRIVSPSIGRARAALCLWFSVPEARGHERRNVQWGRNEIPPPLTCAAATPGTRVWRLRTNPQRDRPMRAPRSTVVDPPLSRRDLRSVVHRCRTAASEIPSRRAVGAHASPRSFASTSNRSSSESPRISSAIRSRAALSAEPLGCFASSCLARASQRARRTRSTIAFRTIESRIAKNARRSTAAVRNLGDVRIRRAAVEKSSLVRNCQSIA